MIFCCRKRNAATGFLLSYNAPWKLVIRAQVRNPAGSFLRTFSSISKDFLALFAEKI